ncbi:MAG: hypothetical protein OEZ39_18205 [Gammaproteobacteria bacterium]|nr:hypothetical protein [Gammaproteobacteria bacterium]MDH5653800.1 hypothetical protein [Gammaproteobacteria bacterium]
MSLIHTSPVGAAANSCEICGDPIDQLTRMTSPAGELSVCKAMDCQRVSRQKSLMEPVLFTPYLEFNKKLIRKNRQMIAAEQVRVKQLKEQIERENAQILQAVIERHAALTAADVELVEIPSGVRSTDLINRERLHKYRTHLQHVVTEALTYENADAVVYDQHRAAHEKILQIEQEFSSNPAIHHLCDTLCTLCKGGCCIKGAEHAYLSVFSMRQYMDEHPDVTAADIVDLYLSHVPALGIQGSCINQTRSGCSLPRELRSDICNGYYCDTLKAWKQQAMASEQDGAVLVVQRCCDNFHRFDVDTVVDVSDVRLLDETGSVVEEFPVEELL